MYNSGLVENIKILYLHFELETEIIAAASVLAKYYSYRTKGYDEESDHSNKAVRKTPEIESGHKVSEEVK